MVWNFAWRTAIFLKTLIKVSLPKIFHTQFYKGTMIWLLINSWLVRSKNWSVTSIRTGRFPSNWTPRWILARTPTRWKPSPRAAAWRRHSTRWASSHRASTMSWSRHFIFIFTPSNTWKKRNRKVSFRKDYHKTMIKSKGFGAEFQIFYLSYRDKSSGPKNDVSCTVI